MTPREHMLYLTDDNVRAVLRSLDPKTQTRRVVKLPHNNPLGQWAPTTFGGPNGGRTAAGETVPLQGGIWHTRTGDSLMCPYGQPGDRMWGREAWCHLSDVRTADPGGDALQRGVFYRADYPGNTLMHDDRPEERIKWHSSRFMPRWASRITLEIIDVRVERLHAIDERSAIAEGIGVEYRGAAVWHQPSKSDLLLGAIGEFARLWDGLNASRGHGWDANPFVWVVEFRRINQ